MKKLAISDDGRNGVPSSRALEYREGIMRLSSYYHGGRSKVTGS
jgi:hypothetical protein